MSLIKRIGDAIDVLRGVRAASDSSLPSSTVSPSDTGTGFGQAIDNTERLFAVSREPIAYRVVYMVAHDVFDKWFSVEDTGENPDEKLDGAVQEALSTLNAKSILTELSAFERLYGYSVLVMGFRDGANLGDEVMGNAPLEELAVYDPTDVATVEEDTDPESLRFALPNRYLMQRGIAQTWINYTRAIHCAIRLLDHRYKGMSVLDPIWDDLTCLRNIRWGMAQTLFRYGSGFPDITLKGATKTQIDDFTASGVFKNVHARTYFVHNENQSLDFKGVQGSALNPQLYYEPILENISAGCGIPKALLRGAQAGALTGSEVNLSEYFKFISDQQSLYEPVIRSLIDTLIRTGQIKTTAKDYRIEWVSGFQHSDQEEAQIELVHEQAQQIRTSYMTINEVRALADPPLPPLPDPEGSTLISLIKSAPPPISPQSPTSLGDSQASHPTLVEGLKAIVNRCASGESNRAQAIQEAKQVIGEYVSAERSRAQAYLRGKTGIRTITTTPEMERQIQSMAEEYLADFQRILDDALRNGGAVE